MIATEVTTKAVKSIATMNSFGAMSFMLVMSLKTEDNVRKNKGIYVNPKAVYISRLSTLKYLVSKKKVLSLKLDFLHAFGVSKA